MRRLEQVYNMVSECQQSVSRPAKCQLINGVTSASAEVVVRWWAASTAEDEPGARLLDTTVDTT